MNICETEKSKKLFSPLPSGDWAESFLREFQADFPKPENEPNTYLRGFNKEAIMMLKNS